MTSIADSIAAIRTSLPPHARLIAVSKGQGVEALEAALSAGQRDFGENRVQEAAEKWPALKQAHPDIRLHLIGPLQTNKIKDAIGLFDLIHTLDRPKLVDGLAAAGFNLPCLVQVNTGNEAQKAGVALDAADGFIRYARERLAVTGLMCIPPAEGDPSPHFEELRRMAAARSLQELSMGMSGDYETALRHGATYIRVGTAIFGSRA